jgi:hypothetical protein
MRREARPTTGLFFFGGGFPTRSTTFPQERAMTTSKTEQIRILNDRLRQNLSTGIGTAVITTGVAALGDQAVARIVKTIAVYDDFCHDKIRTKSTTSARLKPTAT